jgi:hypothetical protein
MPQEAAWNNTEQALAIADERRKMIEHDDGRGLAQALEREWKIGLWESQLERKKVSVCATAQVK